jgi:DNA invertase Pin-like site-specific DNA recombinase
MKVGYARVSRQDQNPEMQGEALEADGCEQVFEERISSRKESRPELERALEYCRAGDVLVVWKLDRLGRSLEELLELVSRLQDRGVEFRSLRESLDTTTPSGKLVFHVFASLAEFERDMKDRDMPISEVCEAVGVSRATLYRYLKPDGVPRAL